MRQLWAAIAIALVVGSCGGTPHPQEDWQNRLRKENQITALWTQIRDWRREAKLRTEPETSDVFQVRGLSVPQAKAVCPPGHRVPPTCDDTCDLADAICDNAEAICNLAADLAGDDWAQQKCSSAKASCREAKQRCCNCSAKPADGGGAP